MSGRKAAKWPAFPFDDMADRKLHRQYLPKKSAASSVEVTVEFQYSSFQQIIPFQRNAEFRLIVDKRRIQQSVAGQYHQVGGFKPGIEYVLPPMPTPTP